MTVKYKISFETNMWKVEERAEEIEGPYFHTTTKNIIFYYFFDSMKNVKLSVLYQHVRIV